MTCTGELLTGYFPEALVLTCSSLLAQKCGVCRSVTFPLLKSNLDAKKEQYLFFES